MEIFLSLVEALLLALLPKNRLIAYPLRRLIQCYIRHLRAKCMADIARIGNAAPPAPAPAGDQAGDQAADPVPATPVRAKRTQATGRTRRPRPARAEPAEAAAPRRTAHLHAFPTAAAACIARRTPLPLPNSSKAASAALLSTT